MDTTKKIEELIKPIVWEDSHHDGNMLVLGGYVDGELIFEVAGLQMPKALRLEGGAGIPEVHEARIILFVSAPFIDSRESREIKGGILKAKEVAQDIYISNMKKVIHFIK